MTRLFYMMIIKQTRENEFLVNIFSRDMIVSAAFLVSKIGFFRFDAINAA